MSKATNIIFTFLIFAKALPVQTKDTHKTYTCTHRNRQVHSYTRNPADLHNKTPGQLIWLCFVKIIHLHTLSQCEQEIKNTFEMYSKDISISIK